MSYVHNSLDFLIKCPRDVDEDTEKVMLDVINLYINLYHEFEALNSFLAMYQGDLHPRFTKGICFRITKLYT